MQKLHFSIQIQAPREKVWQAVIGKETYPQWTSVFSPGSNAQGDWSTGSKMLFIAANAEGKNEGMVSTIAENRAPEFLSIQHLGYVKDGVEDTESPEIKAWAPAFENYTLSEKDGGTEFVVDMDAEDAWVKMFEDMWPKALQKLKEISEA